MWAESAVLSVIFKIGEQICGVTYSVLLCSICYTKTQPKATDKALEMQFHGKKKDSF